MRSGVTIGVIAASLAVAAPASADTRYASPGGTGPPATCPVSNPCGIVDAVENGAADGDDILLAQGTYAMTANLDVTDDLNIRPIDPALGRPVLTSAADPDVVDVRTAGALLSDLEIRATGPTVAGMSMGGGGAERLVVTSGGGGACIFYNTPAVLRDSSCVETGGNFAIGVLGDESSDDPSLTTANVTAVSTGEGPNPYGIWVAATANSATATLDAHNTIAYGDSVDVQMQRSGGATSASATLSSSNFDSVASLGGGTVTPAGSPGNQTSVPQFVNLAGADVHQAGSSETIDAGVTGFLYFGALDVDRQPRVIGSAPDIGADEYLEAPDTAAPDTTLTRTPKKKVKSKRKRKKAKFAFESSEPGSSFACSLDGGPALPCDSGRFVKKVKRGKHAFEVAAIDAAGNTDPTPAEYRWKLKRKR